jgi:hypothetical protein
MPTRLPKVRHRLQYLLPSVCFFSNSEAPASSSIFSHEADKPFNAYLIESMCFMLFSLIEKAPDFVFMKCGLQWNWFMLLFFPWWHFAESGDYIAREGEPVDGLCIILDGQVWVMLILNCITIPVLNLRGCSTPFWASKHWLAYS